MENRRKNFRHRFPESERSTIRMKVVGRHVWVMAQVVDLGMDGMRVHLGDGAAPVAMDDRLIAELELVQLPVPLTVFCRVVYLERIGTGLTCGVQFLPLLLRGDNDKRDRILWNFLKDKQQQRGKRRSSKVRLRLFTGA